MRSLVRFPKCQARVRRRGLVTESEALLEGTFLEYLVERRQELPVWAPLNAAAHGNLAWISAVAARGRHAASCLADPLAAESAVAAGLLDVVGENEALLTSIQQDVLVPLEARLMAGEGPTPSLAGVVASARSLLYSRRT